MRKVLITGIAGGHGKVLARKLLQRGGYRVCGVDRSPWNGHPPAISFYQADVRKKAFDEVIRKERPDSIVHLAFIRHFAVDPAVRHEVNVNGTKRLIEFAIGHGVKSIVVFSSSYVYGALPENPHYMDETFPLSVSRTYPEVRDLTEVDMLTTVFLCQYSHVAISILRPVNVLGRQAHTAMNRYLRHSYVPTVLGFNPMMQFIHEEDLAEAMALAIERDLRGTFNVVGPGAVPLKVAVAETGGRAVPLPEVVTRPAIGALFRWGLYPFPPGAIDFTKYPCTLDGSRFQKATGFTPRYGLEETFAHARRRA